MDPARRQRAHDLAIGARDTQKALDSATRDLTDVEAWLAAHPLK